MGRIEAFDRLDDRRPPLFQLGPIEQRNDQKLRQRDGIGHDRLGKDLLVSRMESQRRIEVQEPAQAGRGNADVPFRLNNDGLPAGQLGGGAVGIPLRPWPAFK